MLWIAGAIALPGGSRRAALRPCFLTGDIALPKEVATGVDRIAAVVQCDQSLEISPGVPNLLSSGTSLSSIDFQTSRTSPLGFAESQFGIPSPPSAISAKATAKIGAALDLYLAWEAALRSQSGTSSSILGRVKSVKFFLQFQQARINQAKGVQVGVADTVEHQLQKVLKNAVGASKAERDLATSLSQQIH